MTLFPKVHNLIRPNVYCIIRFQVMYFVKFGSAKRKRHEFYEFFTTVMMVIKHSKTDTSKQTHQHAQDSFFANNLIKWYDREVSNLVV